MLRRWICISHFNCLYLQLNSAQRNETWNVKVRPWWNASNLSHSVCTQFDQRNYNRISAARGAMLCKNTRQIHLKISKWHQIPMLHCMKWWNSFGVSAEIVNFIVQRTHNKPLSQDNGMCGFDKRFSPAKWMKNDISNGFSCYYSPQHNSHWVLNSPAKIMRITRIPNAHTIVQTHEKLLLCRKLVVMRMFRLSSLS